MIPTRDSILKLLPPSLDKWVRVVKYQDTDDIINTMFRYHEAFRPYYDRIGWAFVGKTIEETVETLFAFCKRYIRYVEEDKERQTTAVPNGVLMRGYGDCKAYASFIAGCLDAIDRQGLQDIDWWYFFASYDKGNKRVYHVFVAVRDESGGEIWVDPTPGANNDTPVWSVEQRV